MAFSLDELLNDGRLERLFSQHNRACALQLWVLRIKLGEVVENRVVYGRLLPYNYVGDTWNATQTDQFQEAGNCQAQILKVNLYTESANCPALLRLLSAGRNLAHVSGELKLKLNAKLGERIGTTTLAADRLVYRPVAYLLNRDAPDRGSLLSPHARSGAFSAALTRIDKASLFHLGTDPDAGLAAYVINELNGDTGLNFGGADSSRLGDLELLVFPVLDDNEQLLLHTRWTQSPRAFVVTLDRQQLPHYTGFRFRLSVTNDAKVVHSLVATGECRDDGVFECRFEVPEPLYPIADTTQLEVFGFSEADGSGGTLCCRWGIRHMRQFGLELSVGGNAAGSIQLDWLTEVTTRRALADRVKAAQAISQGRHVLPTKVGNRELDPWADANRGLDDLLLRLHPRKSDGQFFERWSQGEGTGRLEFVEWWKALLAKHQAHEVLVFDPFFEDVGINLVVANAGQHGTYSIFTALPESPAAEPVTFAGKLIRKSLACCDRIKALLKRTEQRLSGNSPQLSPESKKLPRFDNMLASAEHFRPLMRKIKVRIYGLKEGLLHDRYILIVGRDGLPVEGFHLSNSLQAVAEKQPLLITPIPQDVLLKVVDYASRLLAQAAAPRLEGSAETPNVRQIFDSQAERATPRPQYAPLQFLESPIAGDVLAGWTGEASLKQLNGGPLKVRMAELGLLQDESLNLPEGQGLGNCLDPLSTDLATFSARWQVLGEILAHSPYGDLVRPELVLDPGPQVLLAGFLAASFDRRHIGARGEPQLHVSSEYFLDTVEGLLGSFARLHAFYRAVTYEAVTWPEYYAIKYLWWYAPDALLSLVEAQAAMISAKSPPEDPTRLLLLSQIVSEISIVVQFECTDAQRNRLIRSPNGLLQWMGVNALESRLRRADGLEVLKQALPAFSARLRVLVLGWMINHVADVEDRQATFIGLVDVLHQTLPPTLSKDDLKLLLDSLRGPLRPLAWIEPWLTEEVIKPLLNAARVSVDDLCEIRVQELVDAMELALQGQSALFDRVRDGRATKIAAHLLGRCSEPCRKAILASLHSRLDRLSRDVLQPLASTSNWTRWDRSLFAAMWIFALTRWTRHLMADPATPAPELDQLSIEAREIALRRTATEWRADTTNGLASFIEEFGQEI